MIYSSSFCPSTFYRIVEKKKKIACEFNLLNEQMAAIGRLLLLENHSLHGMVQELLREKKYLNKLLEYVCIFREVLLLTVRFIILYW